MSKREMIQDADQLADQLSRHGLPAAVKQLPGPKGSPPATGLWQSWNLYDPATGRRVIHGIPAHALGVMGSWRGVRRHLIAVLRAERRRCPQGS